MKGRYITQAFNVVLTGVKIGEKPTCWSKLLMTFINMYTMALHERLLLFHLIDVVATATTVQETIKSSDTGGLLVKSLHLAVGNLYKKRGLDPEIYVNPSADPLDEEPVRADHHQDSARDHPTADSILPA